MKIRVGDIRLFFDVEGARLQAVDGRMKERPTLILLHGGPGADHSIFKPYYSALADAAQVIYLDQRGHGRSERGSCAGWNLNQWSEDLFEFCQALGIDKPIVLGHSFGGQVALAYATRYPDHPGKLILSSTAAVWRRDRMARMFERLGGPRARDAAIAFWENVSPQTGRKYREVCEPLYNTRPRVTGRENLGITNWDVLWHFYRHGSPDGDMNYLPELGKIRCPTLILTGAQDPVATSEDARDMACAIRGDLVRLEIFDDCGHGVTRDSPERAFAVLKEFIVS